MIPSLDLSDPKNLLVMYLLEKALLVNITDAQIADLSNRVGMLIEENSLKQALEVGERNLQSVAQEG